MKQRHRHRLLALIVILALAAGGIFWGRQTLAQSTDTPTAERVDGRNGQTGQRLNMTPEEAQAMLLDESDAVYHFAGGLNNTDTAVHRATVVQCTNVSASETTELELQLFQYNATSVYTGTVSIDPLDTATFESSPVEFYAADVVMGAGFVEQGYGRILSTHDEILCTVQTIDPDNIPPTWGFNIPLYTDPLDAVFLPTVQNNN